MASSQAQPLVKSAIRTLDVIEFVAARPSGATTNEISAALLIPTSSLSYLLSTLVDRGYLARDRRLYVAGPGLERLRQQDPSMMMADRARPVIRALRDQLNETASFFERREWDMEAVVTETADQTLRYSVEVGGRIPLHCGAAGKAFLACLPAQDLETYLDGCDRKAFTPNTLIRRDDIIGELERIRSFGYARSREEFVVGLSAIGVAIRSNGLPVGAISVAVPSARFTQSVQRSVVDVVTRSARGLQGPGLSA